MLHYAVSGHLDDADQMDHFPPKKCSGSTGFVILSNIAVTRSHPSHKPNGQQVNLLDLFQSCLTAHILYNPETMYVVPYLRAYVVTT